MNVKVFSTTMKEIVIILVNVYLICQPVTTEPEQPLLVCTSYGSLQGKWMTSRSGREFGAFLGIPYATGPTGKLRFLPPTPPQKWEGVRDATKEGNVCIQRGLNGSEDCLYLNVFTHNTLREKQRSEIIAVPVMVFIHGGGFYRGSSDLSMTGPEYLMDRDIVLVTIQYRLGVFGFLSTEDTVVPGNMGLKDQVRALQWVQESIHIFGGDRSKVTIFGNSAGSSSVHLHMLSPVSKDLFARAISESGTGQSAFAMIDRNISRNFTLILAQNLHCNTTLSHEILQCLQNTDSAVVQEEYRKLQDEKYVFNRVMFRPVVEEPTEHAFITSSPLNTTSNKPWLVGLNDNEGLFKINTTSFSKINNVIHSNFSQFGPAIMFFEDSCSNPAKTAEMIYNYYFKNATSTNETIQALEQVISDSWFIWPTMQAIENHDGVLYCYLFQHRGEHSLTDVLGGPRGSGVSHGDELQYLFSQKKIFPGTLNEIDTNISKLLINLWVNFAEKANPTPHPIFNNPQDHFGDKVVWEPSINKTDPKFFLIQTDKLSMKNNIFSERMSFWRYLPIRDKYTR